MTNHHQTQCFSTHLTTFTSALRFLDASIDIIGFEMSSTAVYMANTSFQVIMSIH